MTIIWIAVGLVALVSVTLFLQWRERNQAEAVKQYVLETAELERQLALVNPRLARGIVVVAQTLADTHATHVASLIDPSSRIFKGLDTSLPSERTILRDS